MILAAQTKGIDLSQRKYCPTVAAIESTIGNDGYSQDHFDPDEAERIVSNVLVMPSPNKEDIVLENGSLS